ncbi:hypothetical protein DMH01_03350 [Amycolatopsis sp. WAC 04182]|uniref:VG15 protein n=1 Tax=Amycolatopsis sp. WAC 04182 TaxID=2203198 RepID=UPI000F774917|nr:hypothetical protein [Amycolatopsis sp. WAC 04182]RSN65426.1 hypothetical protein DMH01_03350 [Amycolatopsis sp. WAC 04182]
MTPLDRARSHHAARARLAKSARGEGRRLWAQVEPRFLEESWLTLLMRMFVAISEAQLTAARQADQYTAETLRGQGYDDAAAGQVVADALSGIASNGRPLESLLMGPVFAAKAAIGKGATPGQALAVGQIRLDLITRTQVADAGRVADGIAVVTRPKVSWTRMVVGDSCPKCIILAGRVYRYSQGFERHPQCDCVHIPTAEDTGGDFTTDPRLAFEQGRVKGLSKADEQAIKAGADMAQVVNAHKDMYVAGVRKLTRTGITRRGTAGRRLAGRARLMPEQIYREATSREEAVKLLRQHGYIV